MRRFWPLAFLAVLAIALLARQAQIFVPEPVRSIHAGPLRTRQFFGPGMPPPNATGSATDSKAALAPPANPEDLKASTITPITRSLLWSAGHQNADGSWGDVPIMLEGHPVGKVSVTSLVILSFLSAGYSPYSREEFPDPTCAGRTLKFGEAVKKGLKWLLEEQGEDGTFRSGVSSFDQVLGALALTEAYGSTTSTSLKDPAQHALDAMAQLQKGDGSWGGAGPTAWALQALSTGDQSELTFPREAQNRAVQVALGMEHPANLFSLMVVTESRGFSAPAAVGLASAPPDLGDYLGWYYASRGLVQFEGPQGPLWTAWRGPLEAALVRQQTRDGSWTGGTASGTGVRSSLASMILQVCHGYFR